MAEVIKRLSNSLFLGNVEFRTIEELEEYFVKLQNEVAQQRETIEDLEEKLALNRDNFLTKVCALSDVYGVIINIKFVDECTLNIDITSNVSYEDYHMWCKEKIHDDGDYERILESLEKACSEFEHTEGYIKTVSS